MIFDTEAPGKMVVFTSLGGTEGNWFTVDNGVRRSRLNIWHNELKSRQNSLVSLTVARGVMLSHKDRLTLSVRLVTVNVSHRCR